MRIFFTALALTVFIFSPVSMAVDNPAVWEGPFALQMIKRSPTIDLKLNNLITSRPDNEKTAVWVFFTDKGIFNLSDLYTRILDQKRELTPAAFERRLRSRGRDNILDFRDMPVREEYIKSVLSTGAELRHVLRWFNAITVNATPSQVRAIADFPFVRFTKSVAHSTTNLDLGLSPAPADMSLVSLDYGPSQGQLEQINVIVAHELGFKGQGVIICMMDTGYRQGHDAFQNIIDSGRLIAQYDFINHDEDTDYDPDQDTNGQPNHGTLTWSTLGGESEGNLYGPSYMASFILSKSEDISSERHIEEDNWAAGAQWADSIGASVISASLGYRWFDEGEGDYSYEDLDGNTTIVTVAADLAAYNGIAVATAMGNEGNSEGSLIAPADGDSVIACGAVDPSGFLAGFSSFGPTSDGRIKPEVCAQGVYTVCANPYDMNGYTTAGGTSLSTPLIGGACGVLLSAHPNWTPMMVREALMMTADRADEPDIDYGWGIADVGRALYYHPAGDIILQHDAVVQAEANQPIPVEVTISGGVDISAAYLYYRPGDTGDFYEIAMNSENGVLFTAEIPGQPGGEIQYYFKAVDDNGSHAFDPLGGSMHPYAFYLQGQFVADSFEDGIRIWRTGGVNNRWGLTTEFSRTGHLSITDSPTTNYDNDTDSWLESSFSIDLSAAVQPEVMFFYRGVLQSDQDFLYIEASTDGGDNWNQLNEPITGSSFSFMEYSASLNDYVGNSDVRLRFHLVTNSSGQREGIYIDDVTIAWAPTDIDDDDIMTPYAFNLCQNYPNPFNPSTNISFSLDKKSYTQLIVFDLLGRKVRTLISSMMESGTHDIVWDGTDDYDRAVASGIYLYRLKAEGRIEVKRMTLLR